MKTKISSCVDKSVKRTRGGAERSPVTAERHQSVSGGRNVDRRFFMKSLAMGGALLVPVGASFADHDDRKRERMSISDSDAAILRFLAAAEILETDLWQQYTEFANLDGPFADALETIDDDMPTYVTQNTADEFSHQDFLNAFLVKMHKAPVNLEPFRTLPSSPVAPIQTGRLTNLTHLNVDTSWFLRYRSSGNPDFGDSFEQAVNIVDRPALSLIHI